MLVLTRKLEEQIRIGKDITISILRVKGNTVRVGIEAPREIRVVRGELPPHTNSVATETSVTSDEATVSALDENTEAEEGPSTAVGKVGVGATTAVRQFLSNRARRRNCSPKPAHPDQVVTRTLTRSA